MSNKLQEAQARAQQAAEQAEALRKQLEEAQQAAEQAQKEFEEAQQAAQARENEVRDEINAATEEVSYKFNNFKEILRSIPPQLILNFIANIQQFTAQDVNILLNTNKEGDLNLETSNFTDQIVNELNQKLHSLNFLYSENEFVYSKNENGIFILTKKDSASNQETDEKPESEVVGNIETTDDAKTPETDSNIEEQSSQQLQLGKNENEGLNENINQESNIQEANELREKQLEEEIKLEYTIDEIKYTQLIDAKKLTKLLFDKNFRGTGEKIMRALLHSINNPLTAAELAKLAGLDEEKKGYPNRYINKIFSEFLKESYGEFIFIPKEKGSLKKIFLTLKEEFYRTLIDLETSTDEMPGIETVEKSNSNENINTENIQNSLSNEKTQEITIEDVCEEVIAKTQAEVNVQTEVIDQAEVNVTENPNKIVDAAKQKFADSLLSYLAKK